MKEYFSTKNVIFRTIAGLLAVLHFITFGPVSDALAFYADSTSYKLFSGTLSGGGGKRSATISYISVDSSGEPAIGSAQSTTSKLDSGFVPTVQSNPPTLLFIIPYQNWPMGSSRINAFDLDDYFSSPDGSPLTYSVTGNSNIDVSIEPATHLVSFSQDDPGWFGIERVFFTATDREGSYTVSNNVVLQVENTEGQDKPAIAEITIDPSPVLEGDSVKVTVKARDLDNEPVNFAYDSLFTETRRWQEGDFWFSEAAWQTGPGSTGHYYVNVTAFDQGGLSDTRRILINVGNLNHPPIITNITVTPNPVNEKELVRITPTATDEDNDPVTFYYSAPFNSQGTWTPDYNSAGSYTVRVTASDSVDVVSQNVSVTVLNVNQAPSAILTLNKYTVEPNEQFTVSLTGTDPDSEDTTLNFKIYVDANVIDSGTISNGAMRNKITSIANEGYYTIKGEITDAGSLQALSTKALHVAVRKAAMPVAGDFNGDSLTDLGMHDSNTGRWEVALSDGGQFYGAEPWLTNFGASKDWASTGGDFNGDTKSDVAIYNSQTGEFKVALSTGSSFTDSGTWLTVPFASSSWQFVSGNFNGDKYSDVALYNVENGEVRAYLGTGTGFGAYTKWLEGSGTNYAALSGDFNGDGLTDLGFFNRQSGEFKVAFSNTKAFVDGSSWISGYASGKDPIISDFNSDGLTDVGYWDRSSFNWYYAISKGNGFIDKGIWLSGFGRPEDDMASTGDFDGNGVTDCATFDSEGLGIMRWNYRLSTDRPADLLAEINNGMGGKTAAVYNFAPKSVNLPFPVYVTSLVSLTDALPAGSAPETYSQNFSYSGGYFDAAEREFRGFAKVTVTDAVSGNYTETYFYQGTAGQDGALKGQIEKIVAWDGTAKKISETINTYEVKKAGPATGEKVLGFPALKEVLTTVYENGDPLLSVSAKVRNAYDNIGNITSSVEEGDLTRIGDERYAYTTFSHAYGGGFNRPLSVALKDRNDQLVSQKNFEYDNYGNLTEDKTLILNPLTGDSETATVQYEYNSFGNVEITTNPKGVSVTTDYEDIYYAYPRTVTNILGHTTTYEYDARFGLVKTVTDPNNCVTETSYDSLGRVQWMKNAFEEVMVNHSYPDFNTKITTKSNLTTTQYIDGLGRNYKTVSPGESGNTPKDVVAETFFNPRGLVDRESLAHYFDEPSANISYIRYEYDLRGRVTKTTSDFPGTSKDSFTTINYITPLYTEVVDPLSHRKTTLKDVYENILEVREFVSGGTYITSYEYDLQNNLIKTVDAQANMSRIYYDSAGRKIKTEDPDMGIWTYEYDLVGNLTSQTDAKNQTLEFEYDELNRLTSKRCTTGALATYVYDIAAEGYPIGRLARVIDNAGTTEFFYDKVGREAKSIKTVDSVPYQIERSYDVLDRLTSLRYPDGEVLTYTYDVNSVLLEKVEGTPPGQGTTTYAYNITYNALGQIKNINYGNNIQTTYNYGNDLRLQQILTKNIFSGVKLQNMTYDFDKNGNLKTLNDLLRSNIRTYIYDDLDRLTEARNLPDPANPSGYTNFYYQYDSIGNMTYNSSIGWMSYGLNAGPHAVTYAGGYNYFYDDNGNMTSGRNRTMEYDFENRLISVIEPSQLTAFTYDGDGGRVKKSIAGGLSTTYIGPLYEIDSDGRTRKNIFAGANRFLTVDKNGAQTNYYYSHQDHINSSNAVSDQNGLLVQHLEYVPYGALSRNEGTDVSKQKFTGKELDTTGLYFYGARYYDPELGRFITADSLVQAPYDPQSLNRYSYCRNNPIKYVDPSGHFWFVAAIIAIAKAAAIGAAIGAGIAAVTGGDIGKGALFGAISGAIFLGVSQLAQAAMKFALTGTTQVSLIGGARATANIVSSAMGGAAAGAAIAGISGADVGEAAWKGAAMAGGFSLIREVDYWMTSKMEAQSARGRLNSKIPGLPGKAGVGKYGGTPLGGNRFDPNVPFSEWVKNPSPLGGLQGSTGRFLFFDYSENSIWHKIVETYSGAHDFLNSWAYDSATGYMRNLNVIERVVGSFTNPLNVVLATPIAVPSALPPAFNSVPTIVYGLDSMKEN